MLLSIVALAFGVIAANAQVVGKPFGMAAGTTGGGNAKPVTATDIKHLASLLADDVPRVILINKEMNFIGSEGKKTEAGCDRKSCPVSKGGQGYIGTLSCAAGDTTITPMKITYDAAGPNPLKVGSNKSIVGVGSKGVLKGKGLRLNGAKNVIIQNIFITDLNPQYVWGGDAITLQNTDNIWIDHCKFSLIGRQHIVSGWDPAGRVTISNNEFDGRDNWSASCNGQHYWTLLLIGSKDAYTFSGNWLHDLSGRAPHYGTDKNGATNVFHAVNNLFENMSGHAFDIEPSTWSLIEGNAFVNVKQPMTPDSSTRANQIFDVPAGSESACKSIIGRNCVPNSLDSKSGKLGGLKENAALTQIKKDGGNNVVAAAAVNGVAASVKKNAGIGKIN
ncbi:pectin lyase-like protein [Pyrenochaeta sp. DS3sAY3a]|nr:pectin lyase-like protein [Pyrenochaeta sp. DS3sAY3a]